MIPYGNVDSENGGQGQAFPMTAVPSAGNVQSDTAPVNYALGYGRNDAPAQQDPMAYYFQLGQQLLQQQAMMQRQMMQLPMLGGSMGGGDSFDLGNSMLTAGFDPSWLAQRLNAASANGAAIGGIGKNPGAGSIPTSGGMSSSAPQGWPTRQGWNTPTIKNNPAGAERLMR